MTFIDHSAIKRTTKDGGLESITLRSDLAARYILQNEALLELFNIIKTPDDPIYKTGITLKESFPEEKITDLNEYLTKWRDQLSEEVKQMESQQDGESLLQSAANKEVTEEIETLSQFYLLSIY
ncbi:unnamed protein product [Ambrosiozyma monospora]|uniref:Unnamed protein product n=1 Tax=Ambrosiozyma monospora TaxID=43982 RepID=A0ACB5SYY7_AMBMO|nr:unnamed protein product [Ambrosiozyma monospora]